jgi:CRP-like cAMP-binding protein
MKKFFDLKMINHYLNKYSISQYFNESIKSHINIFYFKQNENVISKGTDFNYFYFFVEGKLKIYTLEKNGKSLLLRFYKPLEILGDAELFRTKEYKTYVDSTQNSVLLGIDKTIFESYLKDNSDMLIFIIKNLNQKLDSLSNLSSFNLLYPLKNRFAGYLKGMGQHDNKIYDEIKADSLKEISELLGTSYRHFLRVVEDFENNGYIENNRGKIKILNYHKINELSMGVYE